jgi:transposase
VISTPRGFGRWREARKTGHKRAGFVSMRRRPQRNGLLDRKAPGQPSLMKDVHRAALRRMIDDGPTPAIHGVVRWRIVDLCQWLSEEFGICVSETTMSRELRKMGYRKLSARPRHHAQREGAIEEFKKTSPHAWRKSLGKKASMRAT